MTMPMIQAEAVDSPTTIDEDASGPGPESQVEDLDLTANLDGYWPSSKNVTQ